MMRGVHVKFLTAGLIVLAASPAFAQQPRRGGGGFGPPGGMTAGPSAAALLRNDKVQEELNLTDDQKAEMQKAAAAAGEKYRDDLEKATLGVLKPEQAKRLKQIEVQSAGLAAFSKEDVQAALKLTDAQKTTVKGAVDDMQKDVQDLMKDAQGDREKMTAAFKKIQDLRTDAVEQVVKGLSEDQKKTWKDLTGDKFEVAIGQGNFGAIGGGGAFGGAVGGGAFGGAFGGAVGGGAFGERGRRRRQARRVWHPGNLEADRRAKNQGDGPRQGERREDAPGAHPGPRGLARSVERGSQRRPVQAVEGRVGPTRRRRPARSRTQPAQSQSIIGVQTTPLRGRPTAPEAIRGPLFFTAALYHFPPSGRSDAPITA